jgi:hypothetical protein
MERRPSSETNIRSSNQEFIKILRNPNDRYRVNKSPQLVPILSLIQSISLHPISVRSILILSSNLRLDLPSGLFPF